MHQNPQNETWQWGITYMLRRPCCEHQLQLQLKTSNPSSNIGWRHSNSNLRQWQPPLYSLVGVSAVRGGIGDGVSTMLGWEEFANCDCWDCHYIKWMWDITGSASPLYKGQGYLTRKVWWSLPTFTRMKIIEQTKWITRRIPYTLQVCTAESNTNKRWFSPFYTSKAKYFTSNAHPTFSTLACPRRDLI